MKVEIYGDLADEPAELSRAQRWDDLSGEARRHPGRALTPMASTS